MNRKALPLVAVTLALLAGSGWVLHYLHQHQRVGRPGLKVAAMSVLDPSGAVVGTNGVDLPERVLEYGSHAIPVSPEELGWLPPDTIYGRRRYTNQAELIFDLSVVLMGVDRTSIHKPQYCLTGQGWSIDRSEVVTVPVERPYPYDLQVMRLTTSHPFTRPDGTMDVMHGQYIYWFVADGQLTPDHNQRMWWMARDLIFHGILQRWAYVSCMGVCVPGGEDLLFDQMKRFIAGSVPLFQEVAGPPLVADGRR